METAKKLIEPEIVREDSIDSDLIIGGVCLSLVISVFIIGGTIATGVITGLVATIGLGFFVHKMHRHAPKYWNWMIDNPIKSDILVSGFFLTTLASMTLGGLVAGVSATVFSTGGLQLARRLGKVEGIPELKFRFKPLKSNVGFNRN